MSRCSGLRYSLASNDVLISIASPDPAEPFTLWVEAEHLKAASDYFATLLSTSFLEGNGIVDDTNLETSSSGFDDSDDESDAYFASQVRPKRPSAAAIRAIQPTRQMYHLKVTETRYTTYLHVLRWIDCGEISFAALRSSGVAPFHPVDDLRAASPKSVYRLAHLLGLKDLQQEALTAIKRGLTADNCESELVSDVARSYAAVRELCLDYLHENYKAVKVVVAKRKASEMATA